MITLSRLDELFAAIRIAAMATDKAVAVDKGDRQARAAIRAEQSARDEYAYALARFDGEGAA